MERHYKGKIFYFCKIYYLLSFGALNDYNSLMVLQGAADVKSSYKMMSKVTRVKKVKGLIERDLNLEPLCPDVNFYLLCAYLNSLDVKVAQSTHVQDL